jgi:hypothetical protein
MGIDPERDLRGARNQDGGYGSVVGATSEPEPTAMAAIVASDAGAVDWLLEAQRPDGSFGILAGSVASDDTALVSLALPTGETRERALDHVERVAGANDPTGPGAPPYGWPWTDGAHGWIEPTSWGLLALVAGRPSAVGRINDGLAVLRTQECVGGGWNYGTRVGFGVRQAPFIQTTAIGTLAARGLDADLAARGLGVLERHWTDESQGLLSVASAATVINLLGGRSASAARNAVQSTYEETHDPDTVAACWALLALRGGDPSVGT